MRGSCLPRGPDFFQCWNPCSGWAADHRTRRCGGTIHGVDGLNEDRGCNERLGGEEDDKSQRERGTARHCLMPFMNHYRKSETDRGVWLK